MRGPYGNGFEEPNPGEKLILLGGGTGAAPIIMAASKWSSSVLRTYLGFSCKIKGRFERRIRSLTPSVEILIDDPGRVGFAVEYIESKIEASYKGMENIAVYLCGPRSMMKRAGEVFSRFTRPDRIYIAREDVMRCGIGLCGSCGTEKGLRSCVDGPILTMED